MSDSIIIFLFVAIVLYGQYNLFKMMSNLDEDYKDDYFKILFLRFPFAEYFTEKGLKYRRRIFWSWAAWALIIVVLVISKIIEKINEG